MADLLASGACVVCTNRAFQQTTVVHFTGTASSVNDSSSRKRKQASDVRKMYECLRCRTRYIYNERADEWRKA